MPCLTLGELREAGGSVEIECVRCGAVEHRPAARIEGDDALSLGDVGLGLTCSRCGAKTCIADAVTPAGGGSSLTDPGFS